VQALDTAPVRALITYHNPRTPLYSDRFDFAEGRFWPVDDGMGPAGDVAFFFDGRDVHVLANQHGGVARAVRRSGDLATASLLVVHAGDRIEVTTPQGAWWLAIEAIDPGTMQLDPAGGSGMGAVTFRYGAAS